MAGSVMIPGALTQPWQLEATGPATLSQVMAEIEEQVVSGQAARLAPLPTGFDPLDDVLSGGLRPGELLVIGGPMGVGKTIWGLQVARNVVYTDPEAAAVYVCYEHDRTHLLLRLLCLESAEQGYAEEALTLRDLARMASETASSAGLIAHLRQMGRYARLMRAVDSYAERLVLVKASGDHSTLEQVREWAEQVAARHQGRLLLVLDYLQKVPVPWESLQPEEETTTYLTQGLKEMAMALGIRVVAIAAADRPGLKAKRMRLADLRGSSAVQYEADVGLILNNKYAIISREHLVYNLAQAEAMRNYVVLSVEKNRAGRNAIDMEFMLDASHFRIVPRGGFVRERLVDEKVVLG